MAPLLAVLPLLAKIPSAVKEVAGLFGMDKAAKAADVVDHVTKAVTGGQVTVEQEQALDEINAKYRAQMAEIALKEKEAELTYHGRVAELSAQNIQTEAKGDDYTRHTRPMILRRLFWLTAIEAAVYPVVILCLKLLNAGEELLKSMTGFMDGAFEATVYLLGIGFTGYTYVRSRYDKPTAQGEKPKGVIESIIGIVRGK